MVLQEILENEILSVIQFILVIAMGFVVTKLITDFLNDWLRTPASIKFIKEMGYDEPLVELIIVGVKYLVYSVTFIVAVAQFGFATFILDLVIILIALFLISVIILSLKDFIPNITAGFYLVKIRAVEEGDNVTIGNYSGEIMEINMFTTTIEDETGRLIIVPNSKLTKKEIIKEKPLKKNGRNKKR